jgi:hypothetical protein
MLHGESSPDEESTQLDILTDRLHSLNSECESGYDESPSECDLREGEEEEDDEAEEDGLDGRTTADDGSMTALPKQRRGRRCRVREDEAVLDIETFTDEGRVSVESGGGEEDEDLPQDSLALASIMEDTPVSR